MMIRLQEKRILGFRVSPLLLTCFLFLCLTVIAGNAMAGAPDLGEDEPYPLPKNIASGVNVFLGKGNPICHTMAKYLMGTSRAPKNIMLRYLVKYEDFRFPKWKEEPFENYRDAFYEAVQNTFVAMKFTGELFEERTKKMSQIYDGYVEENAKVMVANLDIDNSGVIRKVVQLVNDTTVRNSSTYLHSEGNFIILNQDNTVDPEYNRTQYPYNIAMYNKKTYMLGDRGNLLSTHSGRWKTDKRIGRATVCQFKNK